MSGVVVWFTGLPASGKSTLAARVRDRLGEPCVMLDSDEVRDALAMQRYAEDDRDAFYRALGGLAALLARQGHVVLVAATAASRRHRADARAIAPRFLEVHVATPLAVCESRDVKGLYARARAGDAPTLPGLGVPFEPPLHAEITARDGRDDDAASAVVQRIRDDSR